jgi:hypothetical protein
VTPWTITTAIGLEIANAPAVGLLITRCALVEQVGDLVAHRPRIPPVNPARLGIELSCREVVEVEDLLEMGAAQFSPQCRHNLLVGERFL